MAIDPRISLMGQPSDMASAVMGGIKIGEDLRNRGVRDTILRQSQQVNQMNIAQAQGQYQYKLLSSLKSVPIEQRAALFAQQMPMLEQMGIQGMPDLSDRGIEQGMMATAPFMSAEQQPKSPFAAVDTSKYTPESISAFQQTGDYSKLIVIGDEAADKPPISSISPNDYYLDSIELFKKSGNYTDLVPIKKPVDGDPNTLEIQKETRNELRSGLTDIKKQAGDMYTNYSKLENLGEEMRKGNRSAVAQGLVALVKLGDPGSVVKEEELKMALGAKSPIAAVVETLRGAGVDGGVITAIQQSVDPLNPDTVDVDQIIATADAMMLPNIENILGAYDVANQRGTELLSEQGYNSIFGVKIPLINKLRSLNGEITAKRDARAMGLTSPTNPPVPPVPPVSDKPPVKWSDM